MAGYRHKLAVVAGDLLFQQSYHYWRQDYCCFPAILVVEKVVAVAERSFATCSVVVCRRCVVALAQPPLAAVDPVGRNYWQQKADCSVASDRHELLVVLEHCPPCAPNLHRLGMKSGGRSCPEK